MKKLEKILEEIKESSIMVATSKEPYTHPQDRRFVEEVVSLDDVEKIIREHMNDGWILVERGLPELNEDELSEDVLISFSDSYSICIGFYDFNEKRWYVHGSGPCIGRVVAWRPLPEPYPPERGEEG